MRRIAVVALVLLAPAAARAGGGVTALAPAGRTVWVTAAPYVLAVDARSGQIVRRIAVSSPYPVLLARGGGATWVGSVENGFVAGSVSRIDASGVSTPLRLPHAPVLDLAAGGGAAWVLVGPRRRARLVAIDYATRRARAVALPERPRALAGDGGTAVVVTAAGRLFRLTRAGARPVGRVEPAAVPVAADRNGAWIASGSALSWVDLRDGRRRTILHGRVVGAAFRDGRAYALLARGAATELIRFDQDGGRVLAHRLLPAAATDVGLGAGAVWVTVPEATPRLLRLDPRTLALRASWRL